MKTRELAGAAKVASRRLAAASAATKNRALVAMAEALERRSGEILEENAQDVTEGRKKGLSGALIDRLWLDEERLRGIARSLRDIAALPDPVGEVVEGWRSRLSFSAFSSAPSITWERPIISSSRLSSERRIAPT